MMDATLAEMERAGFKVDENATVKMPDVNPLSAGAVAGDFDMGPVTPQPTPPGTAPAAASPH